MEKLYYKSDCAVYNEPAYPAGPCDCGGIPDMEQESIAKEKIAYWFYVEQAKAEHMTKWCSWEEVKTLTPKTAKVLLSLADQNLALTDAYYKEKYKGYVKLADQRIPENPYKLGDKRKEGNRDGYWRGQSEMLKAGWRRVELEAKENEKT